MDTGKKKIDAESREASTRRGPGSNDDGDALAVTDGDVPALLHEIDVNIVPDEVEVTVQPAEVSPPREAARPNWHYVRSKPSALISLRSQTDRLRVVRLTAVSNAPGWNPSWSRWSYAVRRTPADLGGGALSAQDILAEDESSLQLLVLPGEQRMANLEFHTTLDGETATGDYDFDVVLTDVETGAIASSPGRLKLRHAYATLLNYLPAIYTSEPDRMRDPNAPYQDPPFFERFLRGFEDAMAPAQTTLSNMYRYFDADTAPSEFLPWLSTWVALVLDQNWPELKRRRLINEAVELYRWRGTRRGLSRYLEIYTGVVPQINDQPFVGMRLGSETLLGKNTVLGDVPPHTFVVTLAVPDIKAIREHIVRDIIEAEKPAHAAYEVRIVERRAGE